MHARACMALPLRVMASAPSAQMTNLSKLRSVVALARYTRCWFAQHGVHHAQLVREQYGRHGLLHGLVLGVVEVAR
jgi:hypothetical protein